MNLNMETRAALRHFVEMFDIQHVRDTDIERFMNYREEARRIDIPRDIYAHICGFLYDSEIVKFSNTHKEFMAYEVDTWRAVMNRAFPKSVLKVTKDEVATIKSGMHKWIFYCKYVYGMRRDSGLSELMDHEKEMVWLDGEIMKCVPGTVAFDANMKDHRSREKTCCELYDRLSDDVKYIIYLTFPANTLDVYDIPYYTHKKEPDMRLYGYHPDEKDQELIDRCDEHRKWLTFEYDSESDYDYDYDEEPDYERFTYDLRGRARYRNRPDWIDPRL